MLTIDNMHFTLSENAFFLGNTGFIDMLDFKISRFYNLLNTLTVRLLSRPTASRAIPRKIRIETLIKT